MKWKTTTIATMVLSVLAITLASCQKQEGPAERAGKEADKAVASVGRQVEKVGDSIQDAAKGDPKK
jgi:predicted small secreted protein